MTDMPFNFLSHADPRQLLSYVQHEHPQTIALVLAHIPSALGVVDPVRARPRGAVGRRAPDRGHGPHLAGRDPPGGAGPAAQALHRAAARRALHRRRPASRWSTSSTGPTAPPSGSSWRPWRRATRRSPRRSGGGCSCSRTSSTSTTARCSWCCARSSRPTSPPRSRASAEEVRDKVTSNLSERGRENLLEEIDLLGPVKVKMVEEAQTEDRLGDPLAGGLRPDRDPAWRRGR